MGNLYRNDIADVDISKPILRTNAGVLLASDDNLANRFGANIMLNGQPVDISGATVTGYFIRPNGDTVFIEGVANRNTAHVDLPHECYAVNGAFSLAIKVTKEGTTMTARVVDGHIRQTRTDAVVDPGEVLPSLEELLAKVTEIEACGNHAPAIIEEANGSMVAITDAAAEHAVSLVSHITAAADGTGHDAVSLTRTGKNLVDINTDKTAYGVSVTANNSIVTVDGVSTSTETQVAGIATFRLKPGKYTMSHNMIGGSIDAAAENLAVIACVKSGKIIARTRLNSPSVTFSITDEEDILMRFMCASSSTTYNQYTITAQIEAGGTATEFEAPQHQTLTADLPETVTDGALDWTTGVLTINEDGTTRTMQLDARQLDTLKGTNNIWSSTGDTDVQYVADTKMYIDNKFAELTAAVLSTGANV